MGEIALEWGELMRHSLEDAHHLVNFRIYRDGDFIGIAMLSIIRGLDPSLYVWNPVASLMKRITSFDVGFVEIPLANKPGLLTRGDITPVQRGQILRAACAHIRETIRLDALCVKMDDSIQYEASDPLWKGIASLNFYPNTQLAFPFRSFEAYVSSLSRKKRQRVRMDKRVFADRQGHIQTHYDIRAIVADIYPLYKKTAERVEMKPHYLAKPVDITESFFERVADFPRLHPAVLLARVGDQAVAYGLVVQSGRTLFLKAVGLDYALSHETKAYFNLFYAVLEYAASQGCNTIDFGMTTYYFKQWLGCELHSASYLGGAFHPLITVVQKPVAKLMERRIGTGME